MSKLDDRLKEVGTFKRAREAIYKDLIELVPTGIKGCGELKPQPNDDTPGMIYAQAQNKFRAEFLQKLAEYCGVKE